jgi:hypothetical protein
VPSTPPPSSVSWPDDRAPARARLARGAPGGRHRAQPEPRRGAEPGPRGAAAHVVPSRGHVQALAGLRRVRPPHGGRRPPPLARGRRGGGLAVRAGERGDRGRLRHRLRARRPQGRRARRAPRARARLDAGAPARRTRALPRRLRPDQHPAARPVRRGGAAGDLRLQLEPLHLLQLLPGPRLRGAVGRRLRRPRRGRRRPARPRCRRPPQRLPGRRQRPGARQRAPAADPRGGPRRLPRPAAGRLRGRVRRRTQAPGGLGGAPRPGTAAGRASGSRRATTPCWPT